jgi:hypothetical protein
MRLIDQPAVLEWAEFGPSPGWGQKNSPVQGRKEFESARLAARYAADELPETIRKSATITVAGTPPLHWGTWRAFCDDPQ